MFIEGDLYRREAGFQVEALGVIDQTATTTIIVRDGLDDVLDTFDIARERVIEAFKHTSLFSEPLRVYLTQGKDDDEDYDYASEQDGGDESPFDNPFANL